MNTSPPLHLDNNTNNDITTFNNSTSLNNNNNTLNTPYNEDTNDNDNDDAFIMLIMSFGDGKDEQLKIHDKYNPEKDIYDFCMQKHFDYDILEEIKRQVYQYLNDQRSFHKNNNSSSTNNKKLSIRIKPTKKQNKTKSQKELGGLFQYELSKSYKDVKREYKGIVKERKYSAGNATTGNVYIGVGSSNNNNNNTMALYKNRSRPLSTSSTRRFPLMGINFNSCKHSKQNINININHSQTQQHIHNTHNNIIHEMNPISLIDTQIIKTPSNKYFLTLPSHKTSHIKRIKNIKSATHHHHHHHLNIPKTPKPHVNTINPQFTFNPKINKQSKSLLHTRISKGIACTNSSRILNYNKYIQEQHNKYKAKHACYGKTKETKSNCIFKPQINTKSKYIDSTINPEHNSTNRFERLYNYSVVIKKNIEYLKTEEDDKYTYKPHVNSQINNKIQIPFQQRQSQYMQKLQHKKQQLQQQMQLNTHSTFVPKINNNKHYLQTRNTSNYNVFNKLYAYKNVYHSNSNNNCNNKHIQRYHTIETSFNNNNKNERMLKEKRRKIFTSVFNVLDSDGDNLINARCINYNVLNDELQRILKPVYKELKDENETLSCNEFVQVCEVLYNKMEINAKREFLVEAEHAGKCISLMKIGGCYWDKWGDDNKYKDVDLKYKKYTQRNFAIGLFYDRFVNKIHNEESCEFEGN